MGPAGLYYLYGEIGETKPIDFQSKIEWLAVAAPQRGPANVMVPAWPAKNNV